MLDYKYIFKIARNIAYNAHYNQYRKNGMPYFMHPWRVSEKFSDYKLKTIAILHDTMEDSKVDSDILIKKNIPQEIVDILVILNKNNYETYEQYLECIKSNNIAVSVKIEDILDNLCDFPTKNQIIKYSRALIYLLE